MSSGFGGVLVSAEQDFRGAEPGVLQDLEGAQSMADQKAVPGPEKDCRGVPGPEQVRGVPGKVSRRSCRLSVSLLSRRCQQVHTLHRTTRLKSERSARLLPPLSRILTLPPPLPSWFSSPPVAPGDGPTHPTAAEGGSGPCQGLEGADTAQVTGMIDVELGHQPVGKKEAWLSGKMGGVFELSRERIQRSHLVSLRGAEHTCAVNGGTRPPLT